MPSKEDSHPMYAWLLASWCALFSLELFSIAHWVKALSATSETAGEAADFLRRGAKDLRALSGEFHAQTLELQFLQELPNILPQDKGYLRTQKAIAEDVQNLRQKVSSRVKGELHLVVDAKANKLYVKKGLRLLWQADCSVGRGGTLLDKKTGRRWEFITPRGEFKILGKRENPFWIKPDWAFVEAGQEVPAPDDPVRRVEGELGAFVLNLGDGYLLHGTKDESVLGRAVTHGCVRLGAEDLKKLYESVPTGTKVYIIG